MQVFGAVQQKPPQNSPLAQAGSHAPFLHTLPEGQQAVPQLVSPAGQPHWPLEHVSSTVQQALPQACGVDKGQQSAPPPQERPVSQ